MSLDTFRTFVPFSELLAAIIGTIYFYKYKHTSLKYFLYLLWYNPLCILNNADFNIVNVPTKNKLVYVLNDC